MTYDMTCRMSLCYSETQNCIYYLSSSTNSSMHVLRGKERQEEKRKEGRKWGTEWSKDGGKNGRKESPTRISQFPWYKYSYVWVHALSLQLCPTLCDPMDWSPPGSSVHVIFQARILRWAAIPSPGDLPNPGIELGSPTLRAESSPSELPGNPFLILTST